MAKKSATTDNDDLADVGEEVLLAVDALRISSSSSSGAAAAPREVESSSAVVAVPPVAAQALLAEQQETPASPNGSSETTTTEAPLLFSSLSSSSLSRPEEEKDNAASSHKMMMKKKKNAVPYKYTILCDMSYGLPSEARPRQEKIRAIARQLVNFLSWQYRSQQKSSSSSSSSSSRLLLRQPAQVKIIGCSDAAIEQSLKNRMRELWVQEQQKVEAAVATGGTPGTKPIVVSLPSNLTFTQQSLESFVVNHKTRTETTKQEGDEGEDEEAVTDYCLSDDDKTTKGTAVDHHGLHGPEQNNNHDYDIVYLSPDAKVSLLDAFCSSQNLSSSPPAVVVVGLLIDRKHIQVNRSRQRAQALSIPAVRWPLEKIVLVQQQQHQPEVETGDAKCSSSSKSMGITTLHASEPLNCDCILEGMQQWYWNYETWRYHQQEEESAPDVLHCDGDDDGDYQQQQKAAAAATTAVVRATTSREACLSDAILQALQHHVERHPGRPIHKKN